MSSSIINQITFKLSQSNFVPKAIETYDVHVYANEINIHMLKSNRLYAQNTKALLMECSAKIRLHRNALTIVSPILALQLAASLTPTLAVAQTMTDQASSQLSFEEASTRLSGVSDTLSGAESNVRSARDQADALKALHNPTIGVDVQELEYQKSLTLPLTGVKSQAQSTASNALSGINATGVPGVSSDAVGAVTAQVQQALPSIFASIPNSISTRVNDFRRFTPP